MPIENVPKVSSDFNNVDTIASISYSDEKGKYHKEDIVGIDFRSCLVETVSGDIYSVDNMSELQKNAEQLNIEVPQNIPQIEIIQMQRNNGQSVGKGVWCGIGLGRVNDGADQLSRCNFQFRRHNQVGRLHIQGFFALQVGLSCHQSFGGAQGSDRNAALR